MAFYEKTVGWTFYPEEMPSGGIYWIVMTSSKPIGGILKLEDTSDPRPDRWMIYIHMDRLDEAIECAKSQGATILREPWDVPGVGRVAMLREPGGAEIGWVTPLQREINETP